MLGLRDQGVRDWAVLAGLGVEGASAERSIIATATNPCAKEKLASMQLLV